MQFRVQCRIRTKKNKILFVKNSTRASLNSVIVFPKIDTIS